MQKCAVYMASRLEWDTNSVQCTDDCNANKSKHPADCRKITSIDSDNSDQD